MKTHFHRFVNYVFFSNIFLGIIAVMLSIETNVTAGISLNYFPFYIVLFLGISLYYTQIYVRSVNARYATERTLWYRANIPFIKKTIRLVFIGLIIFTVVIIVRNWQRLLLLTAAQWLLMALFPLLTAWYSFPYRFFKIKTIRQWGMVKPFIIGLNWSGFVTFYPLFIWQLQKGQLTMTPVFPSFFFWLHNFFFISITAIIFDNKDWEIDKTQGLSTFQVVAGIKKTMLFVAMPLLLAGVVSLYIFQAQQQFTAFQSIIQLIPYCFLLIAILQYRKPKTLLYYLAAVDGLLLLKALCGIFSIIFLNKK